MARNASSTVMDPLQWSRVSDVSEAGRVEIAVLSTVSQPVKSADTSLVAEANVFEPNSTLPASSDVKP
jgi:hypothetical protein